MSKGKISIVEKIVASVFQSNLLVEEIAKNKRGITIVSLVITIILMLILVSVTITASLDGSLFGQAKRAVNNTEILQEKEIISQAVIQIEELDVENLKKELSNYNVEIFENAGKIIVKFIDTNRYYEIDENGNVEYIDISEAKIITVVCQDSTGNVLGQEEYVVLRDKYSIALPQIDGYESEVEKIEGEITQDTTINQLYYRIFDDEETLVFTGLNSSGVATSAESEIVSYMVGDGSTTSGNGLKEKNIQGILKIPDTYNDKPVTQIGYNSFATVTNIKKVIIGDCVEKIKNASFYECEGQIEEIVLGRNVNSIETSAFKYSDFKKLTINTEVALTLANESFRDCLYFTEIIVNDNNTTYKVQDNVLYTIDGKTLVLCPAGKSGEFTVPYDVETIGHYAFYSTNITKIVLSDNVNEIGSGAFENGILQEIVMGKKIEKIGTSAFRYCRKLKKVTINTEATLSLSDQSFRFCSNFAEIEINSDNKKYKVVDNILYTIDGKKIVLCPPGRTGEFVVPNEVETIGTYAFGATNITKIVLSQNINTVQTKAFERSGVSEIDIGNVSTIGSNAFRYCSSLETVTMDSSTIAGQLTTQTACGNLINYAKTIYIKTGISSIGRYVADNYERQQTTDKEGYVKYVKK